jgi:hypothetical protein
MPWTALTFGQYRGKTLPQVVFSDPDWFFWACEDRVFENKSPPLLASEARLVLQRAKAIRVPMVHGKRSVAAYGLDLRGTLAVFEIVASSAFLSDELTPVARIDLSLPRQFKGYDKAGGRIVVDAVRAHFFGGGRLTKRRCEEFFENPSNFVLAPHNTR